MAKCITFPNIFHSFIRFFSIKLLKQMDNKLEKKNEIVIIYESLIFIHLH